CTSLCGRWPWSVHHDFHHSYSDRLETKWVSWEPNTHVSSINCLIGLADSHSRSTISRPVAGCVRCPRFINSSIPSSAHVSMAGSSFLSASERPGSSGPSHEFGVDSAIILL